MSFTIMQVASPGKPLDGRDIQPNTRLNLYVGQSVCLVKATDNYAHHKKGDQWVEYLLLKAGEAK